LASSANIGKSISFPGAHPAREFYTDTGCCIDVSSMLFGAARTALAGSR
jgi:hypothetical protein